MKFAAAILVVLVVASPLNAYVVPATGSGALAKEMQDLVDLLPLDKMIELAKVYATQDEQFRSILFYMGNVETKEWLQFIEASPKFVSLLNYIQNSGLDIYYLMNRLNEVLRIPPLVHKLRASSLKPASEVQITGGLDGFISDTAKLLPLEKIDEMFNEKMKNSEVVKNLVHEIIRHEYVEFYLSIFTNEHYKRLESMVVAIGVNREKFQIFVPMLFGIYAVVA